MADATVDQMNMIICLCSFIAALKGRSNQFVMSRLFETKTLKDMGYVDGEITEEQAKAAISIAERWLEQAKEGK